MTDEEKLFVFEAIGRIVDAATARLQEGQAEHSRKLSLLEQAIAQVKQGQADLDARMIDLQIDVQDTKRHVANVSRQVMVLSARDEKNDKRLTAVEAVEATVNELKARIENKA